MSAPQEPRLGGDTSTTLKVRTSEFTQPNNKHVPNQTLADFAYEEIGVRESHPGADDRDGDSPVSSRDGHESPLRREFERQGSFVQEPFYD